MRCVETKKKLLKKNNDDDDGLTHNSILPVAIELLNLEDIERENRT